MTQRTVLQSYYGATLIFLLVDVVFGFSIRITFLDANSAFKMAYYAFCVACFAVMLWQPRLTVVIGATESLLTLVALIVVMGLRVMVPTDQMLESGAGLVTPTELLNFMIAGGIAYIAWSQGLQALHRSMGKD